MTHVSISENSCYRNNNFPCLGQTYFRALRRVGISRVVSNVKVGHHLQFYELHLIAAAFISDHQVIIIFTECFSNKICLF